MASFSSGMNPDVVKTELDDVFFQEFDGDMMPGHANASTSAVFQQDVATNSAVQWENFKGVGQWEDRAEQEDVPEGDPRVDDKKTFNVTNFSKSVDIPKNFFDDNMHGTYERMVSQMARRGRTTRDENAMGVFRNAFSSETVANGSSLISDSHTNLNGDTIDNKLTDPLTPESLNTAVTKLYEQKAQDGVVDGHVARTLLVPPNLKKTAEEILKSEQEADTADNNINVYSSQYGIQCYTSPYLGSAAGGDDNAWFLMSNNHSIYRFVRQEIQTDLVNYKFQRNNNYIYKGEFREVVGAMSYEGIVGSTGGS